MRRPCQPARSSAAKIGDIVAELAHAKDPKDIIELLRTLDRTREESKKQQSK